MILYFARNKKKDSLCLKAKNVTQRMHYIRI